jgi:hypothetical protein
MDNNIEYYEYEVCIRISLSVFLFFVHVLRFAIVIVIVRFLLLYRSPQVKCKMYGALTIKLTNFCPLVSS